MNYTEQVRNYIEKQFKKAKELNKQILELSAKEIHEALDFNRRYPSVCSAMEQMMGENDEYLVTTPSRRSSNVVIRYYLKDK